MSNAYLLFILLPVFASVTLVSSADHNSKVRESPFTEHRHEGPRISSTKSALTTWDVYYAQVDNFNDQDNSTYAMRYNYNLQFCQQNGCPIIIYVGGEWEIDEGWLENGQIYEMGRENGAAMFYTEHRFYGKSIPTTDFSTESLRLLHSSQAHEDLKGFIMMLKSFPLYQNSKVMLFGCSYTGGLVAWMKQKYPELIQVTYSTSGPFHAKDSMFEYLEVITRVIASIPEVGAQCAEYLNYGIQQLEQEYSASPEGAANVTAKLGICPPMDPKGNYDKAAVFQTFGIEFGNMGQEKPEEMKTACTKLVNSPGETYADILVNYRTNNKPPVFCYPTDYDYVKARYMDTSVNGTARLWFYQQCNEFGWFQTTEGNYQAFGSSVLPYFYHQLCRDAYGDQFTDEVLLQNQQTTNDNYGGKRPNVTKAVFVYGSIDPWAPMGVDESLNDEALRFPIEGGDHCWDMFPQSDSDSEQMTEAKINTRAWIKKWLSED